MVEVDLNEVKEVSLDDFAEIDTDDGWTKIDVMSIVCSKALEYYYEKSRRRRVRVLPSEEEARQPARRRRAAAPQAGPAIDLRLGPGRDIQWDVMSRIEALGGSSILLVCEKVVTESDVKKSQQRLLMPPSAIRSPSFLREDERELLKTRAGGNVGETRVPLLETTFETHEVSLRRWEMRKGENKSSTVCYVLTGGWNEVVARNGLRKGDLLQVWSFRVGAQLQLALVAAHNYGR